MTAVLFAFKHPSGEPVVDTPFVVTLRKPSFDETLRNGILLPGDVQGVTDAQGKATLVLQAGLGIYYLTMELEGDETPTEGCMSGLRYKFLVPDSPDIVRVEDLIVSTPTWSRPWDEQALGIITDAKNATRVYADNAKASADKAEGLANSIVGDAARAEAARKGAETASNTAQQYATDAFNYRRDAATSANAANNSAISSKGDADKSAASAAAAKTSETNSKTSETSSKTSETRSAASATAAASSATAASGSADTAATQATNANTARTGAETARADAINRANAASSSATAAAGSATTATQQADRAKTEADRAASQLATKQDANGNLSALARLSGALGQMFYFTSGTAMALSTITTKALTILGLSNNAAIQSEIGLVPQTTRTDTTPGALLSVGSFGVGALAAVALPNNNANQTLPNGDYYTTSSWTGSPFSGTDGRNQGYLSVAVWNFNTYYQQVFCPISPAGAGSGGGIQFRNLINNVWSAWTPVVDGVVALTDPALNLGGLMSTASVSGFTINKFACGLMHIQGPLGTTATLPADTISDLTFAIPSGMFSTNFATPYVNAVPASTFNQYGVVTAYMQSLTVLRCIVRNGPTAQTFALQLSLWGRWK